MKNDLFENYKLKDNEEYLSKQIITYIGNKRSLLPFIELGVLQVMKRLGRSKLTTVDLFSGSGVVSRMLKRYSKTLYANDLEYYSEITNNCYLSNFSEICIGDIREANFELRNYTDNNLEAGFITSLYSPEDDSEIKKGERAFYTNRNAMYIDTARKYIDKLPSDIRSYLLAPLIYSASVNNNTSGVFKGFYKGRDGIGKFGGEGENALKRIKGDIVLEVPVFSDFNCESFVSRHNANSFFSEEKLDDIDLIYMDPPYNQHPYGSNYFMLNLIAEYTEPKELSKVSGIPKGWQRSDYNTKSKAENALFEIIENAPAKFIMISYNSEGFIPHSVFLSRLNALGNLTVLETNYNTFKGSRNLRERPIYVTEFLYLLEK